MKEIKFRGQKVNTNEWVYGLPLYSVINGEIIIDTIQSEEDSCFYKIIPTSIGQYVGVSDKKIKEIYESDIVHCWGGESCQGYWEHDYFIVVDSINNPFTMLELTESEYVELFGDIYNNKDLLRRCKNRME